METNFKRKIVQISSTTETNEGKDSKGISVLFALCDDNTIWMKKGNLRKWIKVIDVPDTEEKETILDI